MPVVSLQKYPTYFSIAIQARNYTTTTWYLHYEYGCEDAPVV